MPGTSRLVLLLLFFIISARSEANSGRQNMNSIGFAKTGMSQPNSSAKTIHVFVALCDNKFQGIVPVPAAIGNGQDPENNLYWGAAYGIKSFFKKSREWKLVYSRANPATNILERLLFKHTSKDIYLLADAYDGQYILNTTIDFLQSSAGNQEVKIAYDNKELHFGGASDLIAYVGHDGLMDFSIKQSFLKKDERKREAIILACYSKTYFSAHLQSTGASPLVWTTGLMAPEAYILHDAIKAWAGNRPADEMRTAAATAYSKFQKCSIKTAKKLFVGGW